MKPKADLLAAIAERQSIPSVLEVLVAELRGRLARHRRSNDGLSKDERETAVIRGRIAEVKSLLAALGEPQSEGDGSDE